MKNEQYIALKIPGFGNVDTPENIPSGGDSMGNIIFLGMSLLVILVLTASIIFTLYGGILWITSQGDKQKLDRARRTILFAIIGIVVMVLSFTIIQTVGAILGVSLLEGIGS